MPTVKYFAKIKTAQSSPSGREPARDFDLAQLGSGSFAARILSSRFFWAIFRNFWPIARFGRVCLVTRYEDVREVRERHDVFGVPFGPEMTELAGEKNFVLGMDPGPEYERQMKHICSAFHKDDIKDIIIPLAKRLASELVASSGGRIDVVQDLLIRVPTEVCVAYFGFEPDDPQAFVDWLMAISALLFGDPFGSSKVRKLALAGALRARPVIDRAIAEAKAGRLPANTLVARLVALTASDRDPPSDADMRAILMGLATGFVPTIALGAGHMLEVLLSRPDAWSQAVAAAKADDDEKLERCLIEAMRFKSPNILGPLRYAKQRATIAKGTWRETKIPDGTTIIAATMSAMFDPKIVEDPNDFDPDRPQDLSLAFGGRDIPHYCIGELMARKLITQTFKPLLRQKELRRARWRAGRLEKAGPFPRHLIMNFKPDAGQHFQSMITICVPISTGVSAQHVRTAIATLGNPANESVRAALDKTQRVHFASITAIEGDAENREPSYVVMELSVDGPVKSAIDAITAAAGSHLLPVFDVACGLRDAGALASLLRKHVRQLKARPWDTSGLNFCGTPELPVTQIEREQLIEAAARRALGKWLEPHAQFGALASSALRYVRRELRAAGMGYAMVRPLGLEPAVSRRRDLGTGEAIKSLLGERRFVGRLTLLIILAAIGHYYLFWDTAGFTSWAGMTPGEGAVKLLGIVLRAVASLLFGVVLLAVGALVLGAAAVWLLRKKEKSDAVEDVDPSQPAVGELMARENQAGYVQNHLTAISKLKPGWFRRLTLAAAFWGIEKLVKHRFRPGFVLDIGTIHFARWFRLPKTSKLVFLANYDGSWESYLEDFITKAHLGQTAVWSNGIGFPKTKYLMFDGAMDGARFKRWVRRQQVPSLFWYSRFPKLTTDQIRNNALICYGLTNARTDSDARAWLDLFSSRPRPVEVLESNEIQALSFGPMGKLRFGELIALRLPEDGGKCSAWLRDIMSLSQHPDGSAGLGRRSQGLGGLLVEGELPTKNSPRVTFGDLLQKESALIVCFSANGLRKFGLDEMGVPETQGDAGRRWSALGSFPAAFVDGMASPTRSGILGDTGENCPENWKWGGPKSSPVDAVLLLYAKDAKTLSDICARERRSLDRHGLQVIHKLQMAELPHDDEPSAEPVESGSIPAADDEAPRRKKRRFPTEPFGFRDGISQPIIRGSRRFYMGANPIHVVAPGEFILGYPDNRGYFPPTPVISPDHDPSSSLPSTPERLPERFPAFARDAGARAPRDFGRNGSFLVIRQIEQDVAGFNNFITTTARGLNATYRGLNVTAHWVAAKMVGRWKDGSSLVRNPAEPGGEPDNDFLLGVEDPQGLNCPIGSHVRRANPRESTQPGSQQQLDISNRHRLLRVGRPFVEGSCSQQDNAAKGLLFMCLNADLERQFEFVQQSYVSSPAFHGLSAEVDPIAATSLRDGQAAKFTIPAPAGPIEVPGLNSFVRIRGGGYFFLPSRSTLRFLGRILPDA